MMDDISNLIGQVLVDLEPGDGVVLYTDGITEARNIHKKFYGIERLCEVPRRWLTTRRGCMDSDAPLDRSLYK